MFNGGRMLGGLIGAILAGQSYHRRDYTRPRFGKGLSGDIGALFGSEEKRFEKFMSRQSDAAPLPKTDDAGEPPPLPTQAMSGKPEEAPTFQDAKEIEFDHEEYKGESDTDAGDWFVEVPEESLDDNPAVRAIRAMVAAAYADGALDPKERELIESRLAGLPENEADFIKHELDEPKPMESFAAHISSTEEKELIFSAAVLALRADGKIAKGENEFAKSLAKSLGLTPDQAKRIVKRL